MDVFLVLFSSLINPVILIKKLITQSIRIFFVLIQIEIKISKRRVNTYTQQLFNKKNGSTKKGLEE